MFKNDNISIDINCMKLIVSLLTTRFETAIFQDTNINFWDLGNKVPNEIAGIYSELGSLVKQNRWQELNVAYKKALKEAIQPGRTNNSLFTKLTRYASTNTWFYHAEKESLSLQGIHWFAPEVFIAALLNVQILEITKAPQCQRFLDQLIQTYTQPHTPELWRQLRVNILFTTWFLSLSEIDKKLLISCLEKTELTVAKNEFTQNCEIFMDRRLNALAISDNIKNIPTMATNKIVREADGRFNFSQFERELRSHPDLRSSRMHSIIFYMIHLNEPQLTLDEIAKIERSIPEEQHLGMN